MEAWWWVAFGAGALFALLVLLVIGLCQMAGRH